MSLTELEEHCLVAVGITEVSTVEHTLDAHPGITLIAATQLQRFGMKSVYLFRRVSGERNHSTSIVSVGLYELALRIRKIRAVFSPEVVRIDQPFGVPAIDETHEAGIDDAVTE